MEANMQISFANYVQIYARLALMNVKNIIWIIADSALLLVAIVQKSA
jgi:hypothetical protein